MTRTYAIVFLAALFLSACGIRDGGYYRGDGPPRRVHVDLASIPDATPRYEPLAASGNRPYRAMGRVYYPMRSARGYRERGIGSWYGRKFHGRRTASGERYDMFAMTAAHRTLPLPSYVRVTNLHNGRSVVVRVNDRGPFHRNRLIDLSYAAAYRIGLLGTGTALVEVEAVFPDTPAVRAPHDAARLYVQIGAFADRRNAERLRRALQRHRLGPVVIQVARGGARALYRVRIGPLASVKEGDRLIARIEGLGIAASRLVVE